jgi:hypothetical protein
MNTSKYITVDEVVRSLLIQKGENTPHNYLRFLDIAHRGLKELTFDVLNDTNVALLTVDSTLRVDLPEDYVDYNFIGIVDVRGRLQPLGHKNDIPKVGTGNTITPTYSSSIDEEALNQHGGGIYGLGGGQNQNGYYSPSIDQENWQMIFTSTEVGKLIYLEYISDGRKKGGATVIHPYAEEALRAYVFWKDIQRKRGTSGQDRELARRDYYNEKRLAKARMKAFTKEEVLQQIRKSFKQSPKY